VNGWLLVNPRSYYIQISHKGPHTILWKTETEIHKLYLSQKSTTLYLTSKIQQRPTSQDIISTIAKGPNFAAFRNSKKKLSAK